jgi:copper chaperone CopZ
MMTIGMASAMANEVTAPVTQVQKSKKAKAEVKEVAFHVDLHCKNCVEKVQSNIAFEKGVKGLEISLENHSIKIKYDAAKTSEEALKAAIEKLGYKVSEEGHHDHHHHHHGHNH